MSFERFEAAVITEAEAVASASREAARKEIDAYLARVRAENEHAFEEAVRHAQTAESRETARQVGLAAHEGRLAVLEAKNRMLDNVFRLAGERLAALGDNEYMTLMAEWLKSIPSDVGGTLGVSPRDEGRFTKAFLDTSNAGRPDSGRFTGISVDSRITGGFIVAGAVYTVDATIDTRMNELRESLAGDLARELFES